MAANPLLSTSKSSDSGLRAALHPLALLSISDYVTRHRLRGQTQPVAGALLGQQTGREITIEVAYDVALAPDEADAAWRLDDAFFADRLAKYREVHKAPALDLVGWWTLAPAAGPGPEVLAVHRRVLAQYNESALLLTFVPEAVRRGGDEEGEARREQQALPLTIYETVYESAKKDDAAAADGAEPMQVEGEGEQLELRFKALGYEIATDEAEMIGIDSVAQSAGAAIAGAGAAPTRPTTKTTPDATPEKKEAVDEKPEDGKRKRGRPPKGKGKVKEEPDEKEPEDPETHQDLNPEEEELISFLGTRANAIKMLHSRISLLKAYLDQLPPSYLTDATRTDLPAPASSRPAPADDSTDAPHVSHSLLRAIQALVARLPLVVPADDAPGAPSNGDAATSTSASADPAASAFALAQRAERSDVALAGLLGRLGASVRQARELGQRFAAVEAVRRDRAKGPPQYGMAGLGGAMEWDAEEGPLSDYGSYNVDAMML